MPGEDLVAKLSGVEVLDLMPRGDLASVLSCVEIDDLVPGEAGDRRGPGVDWQGHRVAVRGVQVREEIPLPLLIGQEVPLPLLIGQEVPLPLLIGCQQLLVLPEAGSGDNFHLG